jgi:hypothetical protein
MQSNYILWEARFCEATKVDLESKYNSQKNQNKTHNTIISSTKSLIATLFAQLMNVQLTIETGFTSTSSKMKEKGVTAANSVI